MAAVEQFPATNSASQRARLLAGLPVNERQLQVAGVSTAVRGPSAKLAGRLLREFGIPRIEADDLARISAPTVLIWGRHDRPIRLRIAQDASARYGWPLHVIEDCADDPPRDQPRGFLEALRVALGAATKHEPTA